MATGAKTAMQRLLDEPKGKIEYTDQEEFLLHVFWEVPSEAAARELLDGLRQCAVATHRDTPCVPTYFFRLSTLNTELMSATPRTIGDHPFLREAVKKLRVGTPKGAIIADLQRKGLDASLLPLDDPDSIDLSAPLPEKLQLKPVACECTEVYLDERAMIEHSGSREFLDAYARVMKPSLTYHRPHTFRFGRPNASVREKILEPYLNEDVQPNVDRTFVFRQPPQSSEKKHPIFLSVEFNMAGGDAAAVAATFSDELLAYCSTFVAMRHTLRENTVRAMLVLPTLPPPAALEGLAALQPARGEAHVTAGGDAAIEAVRSAFAAAGLAAIAVNAGFFEGYAQHERARDIRPIAK